MALGSPTEKAILIVEDNPVESTGLAVLLKRAGYGVHVVRDGGQALRHLGAEPADIIILDMLLPEVDGWKLLTQLRESPWKKVPVIITTSINIASPEWARSLGASDCVRKPVDFEELLRKIQYYSTAASRPESQLTSRAL